MHFLTPASLFTEKKYLFALIITLILTGYQLIRVIAFINIYGGIEHDGGWMLSISRSLAERGAYTTMVSTIADPGLPGAMNVDSKFDIQTADGRIWFFTGNGIGPASIIPDAVVLKIFGTDFWALRAGPLLFYALFLLLAALILYRLAGLPAILLFHAFLFFYPHLSIFLAYEAMGEVPAMFYILWAYLAFAAVVVSDKGRRWVRFLLAGLVVGLALNAKLIALWSISGIFVWGGLLWLAGLIGKRVKNLASLRPGDFALNPFWLRLVRVGGVKSPPIRFADLLALTGGAALPLIVWELVHLVILIQLTDFASYLQHARQRITFILDDGSGVGLQIHSGPEFFWDKFFLLAEVAHPQRWVTAILFIAIFAGGLGLLWLWRKQSYKQHLLAPMWLGWLANTAWFVGLAKTGWPRHFWFGLVLAMMLLCAISVNLLKIRQREDEVKYVIRHSSFVIRHLSLVTRYASRITHHVSRIIGVLFLFLIGWGFLNQPHVRGFYLPEAIVPYWQDKQINNKYDASLPWIIIPRPAQAEVVEYIKQLPPEANIYYPGQHKAAEIPAQTGRIQYPLKRRAFLNPHPADVALIGPSMISPWKDPIQRRDLLQLVEQQCPQPAVKNDFYLICPFADNPPLP